MRSVGAPGPRTWLLLGTLGALLAVTAWWRTRAPRDPVAVSRQPVGIMGTTSSIVAVLPPRQASGGARVLDAAEAELRRLEALFSTWIEASEVSRLNRAGAGEEVPLSPEVLVVLRLAAELHDRTAGAFDVTAKPLIERWRSARDRGGPPGPSELRALRESSSWADLSLHESGAFKRRATVRVDVDGIAKGFAIDRALEALETAGAVGGMVEVGGDLAVFGRAPGGELWPVGIRSPWAQRVAATIELTRGAVCTSGGYARFTEIEGRRYSHIVDPRSGQPVVEVASVTTLAAETATADAWATALAVLGPEGLALLPEGVEARLVSGSQDDPRTVSSPGFPPG